MNKIILILFISFYFIPTGYSQDTIYFDSNWNKCNKQESTFYREILKKNKIYQVIDYYNSGQMQQKSFSTSKEPLNRFGKSDYYTKEGNLEMTVNYKNNQKQGKYEMFYPNGSLKEIGKYENDLLTDKNIQYFENGIIKRESHFKNDKYEGKMTYYNVKGEITGEGNCTNDGWDGQWIRYDKDRKKSIELYGSKFDIKEYRLRFFSDNYVWNMFEKEDYNDFNSYFICCISKTDSRRTIINKPPTITFLFSKTGDIFNNFYRGYVAKEDYSINPKDTSLKIIDSFKLEYKKNNGEKYYVIVLKIHRDKTYFIIESKIKSDDFNWNEEIILNVVKNISYY